MNAFIRFFLMGLLAVLMAAPVVCLPGAVHFLIIIGCTLLLRQTLFKPRIWPFLALCVYTLMIGAVTADGFGEFRIVNSMMMKQVAFLLLTWVVIRSITWREAQMFLGAILVLALLGVLIEMTGVNPHRLIPSPVTELEYYSDIAMYWGEAQRYRGFFTESSVLLAVTTSIGFVSLVGYFTVPPLMHRRPGISVITAIAACATLTLLVITLAKTGASLVLAGFVGLAIASLLKGSAHQRILFVVGILLILLLVLAAIPFLPNATTAYFLDEASALPMAVAGDQSVYRFAGGLLTRVECWRLAIETLFRFPFGVGLFGMEQAYEASETVMLTPELEYMFSIGVFGLKNTIANIMAQTGWVGLVLLSYGLYRCFILPVRQIVRVGSSRTPALAAMYLSAFMLAVTFLLTCETYYVLALCAVLAGYCDRVARTTDAYSLPAPREVPKSFEIRSPDGNSGGAEFPGLSPSTPHL